MRRTTIVRLFVLPLIGAAGCVSENKNKLEGTMWSSEPNRVTRAASNLHPVQSVNLPAGFLELHFHKDGSLFYILQGTLYNGKYVLGMGNTVVFHLEKPVAGLKTHSEKIVLDGNRLTMIDTDGTTLTFRKTN